MVSECGGVSMSNDGWGYGEKASKDNFISRIKNVIEAIYSLDYISGFCYTQLSDVKQETNGLLNEDRTNKIPLNIIREIITNGGKYDE